jgi:hypothetical protein
MTGGDKSIHVVKPEFSDSVKGFRGTTVAMLECLVE